MAIVSSGFECVFVLVDSGGNKSSKVFELTSADIAEALTDAAAILPLLTALTNAAVESYRVTEVFTENNFAYPIGGVEVENIALIVVGNEGKPDKPVNVRIPAPKDSLFIAPTGAARNQVNVTALELLAFMSIYNPGSRAFFSDGDTWDGTIRSGKRIHRGSRRG